MRNDRGGGGGSDRRRYRRPQPSAAGSTMSNKGDTNNQEQNNENSENKSKSRRRVNRNRKPKSTIDEQIKLHDDKTAAVGPLQMTASNLTTLLSELSMGANSLNTANSTSSESLDFEKISPEETNMCGGTSRLAASFSKGN